MRKRHPPEGDPAIFAGGVVGSSRPDRTDSADRLAVWSSGAGGWRTVRVSPAPPGMVGRQPLHSRPRQRAKGSALPADVDGLQTQASPADVAGLSGCRAVGAGYFFFLIPPRRLSLLACAQISERRRAAGSFWPG